MVLLLRSRRDDAKNCVLLITEGMSDPELRLVLELATDEELMEFEEILYSTRFGLRADFSHAVLPILLRYIRIS